MQIDSTDIPASMNDRGGYYFTPNKILGYNGLKAPIRSAGDSLRWVFDEMDDTEWDWWTSTLLSDEPYAEFTQAVLYDDDRNLTTFSHCIVYRPVREKYLHGKHSNVTVEIVDIY